MQLHPAHALEDALLEDAAAGEDVPDHPQRGELHGGDEQHGAEDQRLDVAGALALDHEEPQEAAPEHERRQPDHERRGHEHAQRLVERIDPEDRDRPVPHVRGGGLEQPRLAGLRVRSDRSVVDRHEPLASLDDRLERVGEARHDLQLDGGLAVVGAEPRGGVRDLGLRRPADDRAAEPLQPFLHRGEVLDRPDRAVADHHVSLAREDRRHELRYVTRVVLVVGVRVDDHVGAELERRVEPRLERGREPLVVRQAHDVVDAARARHLERAVARSVVHHEPLDAVKALNRARELAQRRGQLIFLVEAGDLDDQLHAPAARC